jgi:hypothetical protein
MNAAAKMMRFPFSIIPVLLVGCAQPPAAPSFATCESLDSLALGSRIVIGPPPINSFQPPTMDIAAHPFTWRNGTMTSNGYAEIQSAGRAGGSRNEMAVNNLLVSISVGFGQTLQAVRISFGEYGGNLNVSVNNAFRNFDDFAQINGTTIGGVQVSVPSGGLGNDLGQIEFVGTMTDQASGLGQLAVGGQELWIDDICFDR